MRAKFGVGAFHEPARSYACEGVGTVRETRFARQLTYLRRATAGQAPAGTSSSQIPLGFLSIEFALE